MDSKLKKYRTYKFNPKKISNINLLLNGEFFYLIYEKLFTDKILSTYLTKEYVNIELADYNAALIHELQPMQHIAFKVPDQTNIPKIIKECRSIENVHYMGNIFVADASLNNPTSLLIFFNSTQIPRILYDPSIVVKQISYKNLKLNIVSDNLIIGGSKTRSILIYLQNLLKQKPNINTLIYLGASNGYAQLAFAYSLYLLKSNIKLKIYFQDTNLDEAIKLRHITKYVYPNVEYVILKKPFREIWPLIDKEIENNSNAFLIPFGLDDPMYKEYFYESLHDRLQDYVAKIKTLWIVGGSGTLFGTLYKILSNTHFNIVQVGKEIHTDENQDRITLYKSSYPLYSAINTEIPYPTLKSYDGKIWEFADKFINGDYIWNVGGVHAIL
uniref:Tryptophan synthase beta chain-like PALP domain-containing protein n=1 Tax=viral metagenome TaxID=1070528 RepID=A0A6C0C5J5_9ZZZZ